MKRILSTFYALLYTISTFGIANAQFENLTFDVRAMNFTYYDSVTFTDPGVSGLRNVLEFDIYILQTNIPATDQEIMRFALGTYLLNFNFGGLSAADTVGGYASISYVHGTSTFSNLSAVPVGGRCVAIAPSTDQGAYWPSYPSGVLGGYLNLNSNTALGSTSDVQISGVYPGTRVGRFRLKKNITSASPTPYLPSSNSFIRWRKAPAVSLINPNPVSKIFCYPGLGISPSAEVTSKGTYYLNDSTQFFPNNVNLNLKVLMEGMYYPIFNLLARKDSVKVTLRNTVSPYDVVGSQTKKLDSVSFTAAYNFDIPYGTYYVVLNHFNSIEEWSKSGGISFLNSDIVNYDFTTGVSQGYGNNMKMKGSKSCLFSGDFDQDGIIDALDLSMVSNDAGAGLTGYNLTDLNADNFVDVTDLAMVENNIGVSVSSPLQVLRNGNRQTENKIVKEVSFIEP